MNKLSELVTLGIIQSAVPINRGGIILRLFEGVESSGYGVEINFCKELFPEHFGAVLIEIKPKDVKLLTSQKFRELDPVCVGTIVNKKRMTINKDLLLNWTDLYTGWNTTFKKEVLGK